MEVSPAEAVKNNVLGTKNLLVSAKTGWLLWKKSVRWFPH